MPGSYIRLSKSSSHRSIPRALRKTAHDYVRDNAETIIEESGTADRASSGKRRKLTQQSLRDMMPKSRKEGQSTSHPIPVLESDEEMDQAGWVRKKSSKSNSSEKLESKRKMRDRMHLLRNALDWTDNPKATLSHFRVNLSALR